MHKRVTIKAGIFRRRYRHGDAARHSILEGYLMKFEHQTKINAPQQSVFDWFERRGSFRRLMPPWEVAEEVRADENLKDGAQRVFRFPMGPIKMTWVAEHLAYDGPELWFDVV